MLLHPCTPAKQAAAAIALEPLLIARPTPGGATPGAMDGLLPALANRHGLIAGATGTGKTATLQRLVEQVSRIGVPTLLADVKGDLSGLAAAGQDKAVFSQRREQLGLVPATFASCPVEFWDVLGEQGHPLRATISELGPILLTRLLNLNDTQAGVLTIAFRIADDQGLLLLDLKAARRPAMTRAPTAPSRLPGWGRSSGRCWPWSSNRPIASSASPPSM